MDHRKTKGKNSFPFDSIGKRRKKESTQTSLKISYAQGMRTSKRQMAACGA
jgi:hypothetical protein